MSALSRILRSVEGGGLIFHCPGCDSSHLIHIEGLAPPRNVQPGPRWNWNGDADRPTFQPSILITYNGSDAGQLDDDGYRAPPAVCHSFVTNGRIQFLGDCTHAFAGQTVDLPEWKR